MKKSGLQALYSEKMAGAGGKPGSPQKAGKGTTAVKKKQGNKVKRPLAMTPAQIAALIALVQQIIPIVVELLKKKEGQRDLDLNKILEMLQDLLEKLQGHQKEIAREAK